MADDQVCYDAIPFGGITGPAGPRGPVGPVGPAGDLGPQGSSVQGPRGPIGSQGATGIKGLGCRGHTGVQGVTGVANFIDIETYPVVGVTPILLWNERDDALFAGVTGSDGKWVQISAGSKVGITGLEGPQGSTGIQGLQGLQGPVGAIGSTGLQGAKGDTGLQGLQGPVGAIGAVGATGVIGPQGSQGLTGAKGSTGVAGATGVVGPSGATGAVGPVGNTGVGIQGVTGLIGATGVKGATGTQGATGVGATGLQGIQGATGVVGPSGATGVAGPAGLTGAVGAQGPAGVQGTTGAQGVTGINGTTGLMGITGVQGLTGITYGATGVQGATGLIGPALSGAAYYLHSHASDSSNYKLLSRIQPELSEAQSSVAVRSTTSPQLIGVWCTDAGDPGILVPGGIRTFNLWGRQTSSSGDTFFADQMFKRDVSGNETFLIDTTSNAFISTNMWEDINWSINIVPSLSFGPTDHFMHKIYAVSTSTSTNTVTLAYEDSTRASYILTPIAIGLKGATGIQGATGLIGATGAQGVTGVQGITGLGTLISTDRPEFGFVGTGWPTYNQTTLSFDGTSVLTLKDSGSGWSYYRSGIRYTISGDRTANINTGSTAKQFIYIDSTNGNLICDTTGWTLADTKLPVSIISYNTSLTPKWLMAEERHSCSIPRDSHRYEHYSEGTRYESGGTISGYTLNSQTEAEKCFALTASNIADENIFETLAALVEPNGATAAYFNMFRNGVATWNWAYLDMPFKYGGTAPNYTYIEYDNGSGVSTASQNTRWVNSYIALTSCIDNSDTTFGTINNPYRYQIIQGQGSYSSLALAQAENFNNFKGMQQYPVAEWVAIYQLTWNTSGVPASVKGRCVLAAVTKMYANSTTTGQEGNATGQVGPAGAIGSTGAQGATGVNGLQGATGLAGAQGATGVQGLQGATGLAGPAGATGVQGLQGATGVQGIQGATGVQGIQGVTGVGIQGATGLIGATGIAVPLRVYTTTSVNPLVTDMTSYDRYSVTLQTTDCTVSNPIGTPTNFQSFVVRVHADATAHVMAHGTLFASGASTLITTIPAGKNVWEGFYYHQDATKYYCMASGTEA